MEADRTVTVADFRHWSSLGVDSVVVAGVAVAGGVADGAAPVGTADADDDLVHHWERVHTVQADLEGADRGSEADLPEDRHGVKVERTGIDSQEREHGEVIVLAETAAVDAGRRWATGTAAEVVEAVVGGVDAACDVALREVEVEVAEAVGEDDVAVAVVAVVFAEAFVMMVHLAWNAGPCWAIGRDENPNDAFFHSPLLLLPCFRLCG
ncbi:hypothetical protein EV426DRAFT_713771 [Tirmania nivea]|nr:hypothetical protein EV426DRAFT_713771 [Tirmania nivea]